MKLQTNIFFFGLQFCQVQPKIDRISKESLYIQTKIKFFSDSGLVQRRRIFRPNRISFHKTPIGLFVIPFNAVQGQKPIEFAWKHLSHKFKNSRLELERTTWEDFQF